MTDLSLQDVASLLPKYFAPWIQELGLRPIEKTDNGSRYVLPGSDRLIRAGVGSGVICGQAVAAAADTCSVLAITWASGRFRNCTTVDLTTHFMRPLANEDVEIDIEVLSNGRRMAVTRATFRNNGGKPAATATCAFAYLED